MSIIELKRKVAELDTQAQSIPPIDKGGGPPNYGGMEARLTKLETRLDTILPTLATKADISDTKVAIAESKADIIKWLSGGVLATIAIIVSVMAFMLNRVAPPLSAQQPAPIIIQTPAATVAPVVVPAPALAQQKKP